MSKIAEIEASSDYRAWMSICSSTFMKQQSIIDKLTKQVADRDDWLLTKQEIIKARSEEIRRLGDEIVYLRDNSTPILVRRDLSE